MGDLIYPRVTGLIKQIIRRKKGRRRENPGEILIWQTSGEYMGLYFLLLRVFGRPAVPERLMNLSKDEFPKFCEFFLDYYGRVSRARGGDFDHWETDMIIEPMSDWTHTTKDWVGEDARSKRLIEKRYVADKDDRWMKERVSVETRDTLNKAAQDFYERKRTDLDPCTRNLLGEFDGGKRKFWAIKGLEEIEDYLFPDLKKYGWDQGLRTFGGEIRRGWGFMDFDDDEDEEIFLREVLERILTWMVEALVRLRDVPVAVKIDSWNFRVSSKRGHKDPLVSTPLKRNVREDGFSSEAGSPCRIDFSGTFLKPELRIISKRERFEKGLIGGEFFPESDSMLPFQGAPVRTSQIRGFEFEPVPLEEIEDMSVEEIRAKRDLLGEYNKYVQREKWKEETQKEEVEKWGLQGRGGLPGLPIVEGSVPEGVKLPGARDVREDEWKKMHGLDKEEDDDLGLEGVEYEDSDFEDSLGFGIDGVEGRELIKELARKRKWRKYFLEKDVKEGKQGVEKKLDELEQRESALLMKYRGAWPHRWAEKSGLMNKTLREARESIQDKVVETEAQDGSMRLGPMVLKGGFKSYFYRGQMFQPEEVRRLTSAEQSKLWPGRFVRRFDKDKLVERIGKGDGPRLREVDLENYWKKRKKKVLNQDNF